MAVLQVMQDAGCLHEKSQWSLSRRHRSLFAVAIGPLALGAHVTMSEDLKEIMQYQGVLSFVLSISLSLS